MFNPMHKDNITNSTSNQQLQKNKKNTIFPYISKKIKIIAIVRIYNYLRTKEYY